MYLDLDINLYLELNPKLRSQPKSELDSQLWLEINQMIREEFVIDK
jgi:hypothetical protein